MTDALNHETLIGDTRELAEPVHYPRFFSEAPCRTSDVTEVLRAFCKVPPKSLILRVYQDGGNFSSEQARVLASPPADGESLASWWQRMWRKKPTALVLNGVERFHEGLCRRVAALLRPVLAARGIPVGGIDIALFIGDYGYTPFGVHADPDPAFLIPVGSAVKTLSVWSPSVFRKRAGTRDVSFDLATLLPEAQSFALAEGSLFFLPAGHFHIGRNDGLSVTMTVSLGEVSRRALAKKALRAVLERSLLTLPATDLAFGDCAPSNQRLIDEAVALVEGAAAAGTTAADWLRAGADAYCLSMLSNGGFRLSPLERQEPAVSLRGRTIAGAAPFQIKYQLLGDGRMALFVRGACVTIKANPELPAVIDRINEGRLLGVSEIVTALGRRWTEGATLHVLALMSNLGGIEAVGSAQLTPSVEVADARC